MLAGAPPPNTLLDHSLGTADWVFPEDCFLSCPGAIILSSCHCDSFCPIWLRDPIGRMTHAEVPVEDVDVTSRLT